nr:MAG TPA: hypothetical protein [Caudoviricetes sp.]
MTSKNFNRVLTVVVNKLNKCYFNFTKPEDMKSVTIEKSVFLVEHRLGLEIDDCDMFLYITVDDRRLYEIDLNNEVKNSNELFNRVQYLLSLAYGGVYNGDYDELAETEETKETEDLDEYEDIIENEDLDEIIDNENFDENEEITSETLPYVDVDCSNLKKAPKNCLYGMFGGFTSISEMYNDKCFCCPADRQGNRCCGEKWCAETWKRYEAIMNPEWHHVSLNTLANIDFDMLDEKRQTYLTAYRDLKQTLSYLRKCKTQDTYDTCFIRYTRRKNMLWAEGKISDAMWKWIERKLSMQNVESGVWASKCEDATGHHESRRYNKSLRYRTKKG